MKVLGRRGERVLRQVELRESEEVNQEGKVVLIGRGLDRAAEGNSSVRRGEKRSQRSPGNSPPARRRVAGRWVDS